MKLQIISVSLKCNIWIIIFCLETEYDLDNQHDKFWAEKINVPFPYVSDDIDKDLNEWKSEYDAMGHKKLNKDVNIIITIFSSLDC